MVNKKTMAESSPDADPMSDHQTSLPFSASGGVADAPQDFEAALEQLEQLVEQLESGALPLEDSLHTYRRGVELVRVCQQRLARAEEQVKILEADLLRPLDPADVRGDA